MCDKSDNEALQQFETIWRHVDCGIVIIDAETRKILNINPVAARIFGDDASKMLGRRCHDCICPAEEHSCPIMDLGQSVDHSERIFVKTTGERIPIIKSVAKIPYNGKLALLESFTDISQLKEAEAQLLQLHIAEEASRSKSEFLSRMSHEMRTPMNAIIGMTKIAAQSGDIAKLRYCFSMISDSATHLLGLINDVLDMARIEAGKFELDNAPIDIEGLLKKICHLNVGQIEEKDLVFRIFFASTLQEYYMGDALRLAQIITNLLSNAVKFTPFGGEITLGVKPMEQAGGLQGLRFTITDTGIGMAPEQVERLFKPFEQLDTSITRRFGGTGLGLVISKSIAEKMNGSISVRSALGVGSTFTVDLGLEPAPTQPNLVEASKDIIGGMKILVVDSDELSHKSFIFLAAYGVNVLAVNSGSKAFAELYAAKEADTPYDAIFISYNIQDMLFADLVKKCKQAKITSDIIFMGSFIQWTIIEKECPDIKGIKFVFKPLFPTDLINILGVVRGEESIEDLPKHDAVPDFSRLTLLLAEDMPINREIFISLLEATGVHIFCAEDGNQAVELFQADPYRYDCIIMDVQMPNMSGYEATKKIRAMAHPWAQKVPIIAMTADVFPQDIARCIDCGMNAHLAKPIDEKAVMEQVWQYCINNS